MSQLTLNLSDDTALALKRIGQDCNRPPEEIAREMVEKAIALHRLDELRREVREALGPNAPKSEDEAFEQIS